jgi:two-component system OmpR family response regulator
MKKMPPLPRATVLLADDDRDFQKIVRDWLTPTCDISTFDNGEELADALALSEPDLIILDVRMPGPDGFTLCRRIRSDSRLSMVPVLFLTASQDDMDFVRNMEVGGTAYVTKPVRRKELLSKIEELVGG